MGTDRQGRSVGGRGGFSIWPAALLVVCVAVGLVAPSLAAAKERATIYSAFSKCQTGLPLMNDPSTESAACFSNISRFGSAKIGFIEIPFSSPAHMQFGVSGVEAGERGEEGFVNIVPGTTTLESDPVFIPNPFASQAEEPPANPGSGTGSGSSQSQPPASQAPSQSAPKKAKKKRKKHRRHHRKAKHKKAAKGGKHRRILAMTSAQANATPANKIAISVELAGDVEEFNLIVAASEQPEGVAMKLPVRLHLEGAGLGSDCYIGTLANPVTIVAMKVKPETTLIFGNDPNGFPVRLLGSGGSKLEDSTLTVPTVTGCGPNAEGLNELIGLPAASGSSRMVFADNLFEFVEAGYDGTAPEGGAELQAAFDAAR